MREETKLSFAEEARCRWEIYAELTRAAWQAITVEVPEIHDVWEGRAIFASGIGDDTRTSVGKTVDREYLPDVFEVEDTLTGEEIVERDPHETILEEVNEDAEEFEDAEQEA